MLSIRDLPDAGKPEFYLPHNIEAEQALLGALLIDNAVLDRIEFLRPEHFFDPLHTQIFETMTTLIQGGRLATAISLRSHFEHAPPVDIDLTVPQYLGRLVAHATTLVHAPDYAATIRDLSVRRALIDIALDAQTEAMEAPVNAAADAIVTGIESRLYALGEAKTTRSEVTFGQALNRAIDAVAAAYETPGGLVGLSTGLADLDAKTGGLHKTDLIIVAGRPSMGKSALASAMAIHAATRGHPVHFASLEMSAEQIAARHLAAASEIPGDRIRSGTINEDEFRRLMEHGKALAGLPLIIDETGGLTLAQLATRARRVKRQHGTKLLVVDYLQLLIGEGKRSDNRVQEITKITTGLKALAKELEVPVVALSQLSRGVEGRADKRPQLSDLRDSGSIEQDADVVMFVYREAYYVERAMPDPSDGKAYAEWMAKMDAADGKAEVILGKQRHGATGVVNLAFEGRFTRFSNLARPMMMGAEHAQ